MTVTGTGPMFAMRDFQDIDAFHDPAQAIAAFDGIRAMFGPLMASHDEVTFDELQPSPGDHVLDLGCGLGHYSERLTERVGPNGRVVGVDLSHVYIEEAKRRSRGTGIVEYRQADAMDLPFPDASFDAVHVHRVLAYVADPDKAITEALRVLRPGGRVALVEPDMGATFFDHPNADIARRPFPLGDDHRNPLIGRQLFAKLVLAGLRDVHTDGYVMASHAAPPEPALRAMMDATDSYARSDAEINEVLRWVTAAAHDGTFALFVTVVRAVATK